MCTFELAVPALFAMEECPWLQAACDKGLLVFAWQPSLSMRGHSCWGRVRTTSTNSRTSWVSKRPSQLNTPTPPGVAPWTLLRLCPPTEQDRKVSAARGGAATIGKTPHPKASLLPPPPTTGWSMVRKQPPFPLGLRISPFFPAGV